MKKQTIAYLAISIGLLIILFVVTMLRQQLPFWDEAYYLENLVLLENLGFTREFLLAYKGPAGPTYAWIHYILSPLTNLQTPYVRIVNTIFLALTVFVIYLTARTIDPSSKNNEVIALSAMSIPTVYTIAGMALTEMFSVFFLSVFIYLITYVYVKRKNLWILAVVAGIALSLAILGRQPLLMVLLALPIFFVSYEKKVILNQPFKRYGLFIGVTVLAALILPIFVFSIWGNIQPAAEASTGVGFEPKHLVLALGYSALHLCFINPTYFNFSKDISSWFELAGVLVVSVILNVFLLKVSFNPFAVIVSKILPEDLMSLYSIACGSLLASLGILFLYYFLKKQLTSYDKMSAFLSLGFLLIIATSIKVTHQFSARYVAQAFPLLILAAHYKREKLKTIHIITLVIGGILGMISLDNYFVD
ncbi:ArnT family glycosyltransferase [Nonlabens ponticola]|uniref:Phospholipid carrier-dependent glycosyltransferase n=1 Tax=Nonlabens ponticola TaxID=2496866 RepID=A0A3S9MZS5_9FLAO|nr:glycosyltransferase family 39 protein [Nonlabens ponticola]AZQ44573.1 phospholipid carrier-dependent glycosyltransferase [Nonlabens ponticola]